MYFIEFNPDLISSVEVIDIEILKCHEQVVKDRLDSLKSYLYSLGNDVLVSSIIVCNKTQTIIDGHHRFQALRDLGIDKIPVTFINYNSIEIKAYHDERISKQEILNASESGNLLPPKSSKHVIYDAKNNEYKPILMLSSIYHFSKKDFIIF
jgi:hypothetical protein